MNEDNSSNTPQEQTAPETNTAPEVDKTIDDSPPEEPAEKGSEPKSEPSKSFQPPVGQKNKKKRLILIILLLVVVAAVALWWFMMRDSKPSNSGSNQASSSSQPQTTATTNSYIPANVAYAFKDDTGPYTIYWRLASGGDRTQVEQKLATSEVVVGSDVNGSNVVTATDKAIYASTDSGKTYKAITKLDNTSQVTSIKLSTDGQSIVYASLNPTPRKNTVKSVDLSGSNSKDLFSSTKTDIIPAIFIDAYNTSKQQIVYQEGCAYCDGSPGLPILRDLKTNKTSNLISDLNTSTANNFISVAISSDFTKAVYVKGTETPNAQQAVGVFRAAPYIVSQIDLASNKITQVASFGTKGEMNANGTLKSREVHVGFVAGTNNPYYSNDAQLYAVKSGTSSLIYTAAKPLIYIPFVGTDTVIAGSGDQTADYALVNYNITSKKSVTIFSGDNNTVLFGVTTK